MAEGTMRFQLLGSLTVLHEGQPVPIGSRKQRLLLAILASRHGEPVPLDALVDVLWPQGPPRSHDNALRWHIHKLRSSLPQPDRIVWRDSGYALRYSDGECDIDDFERLHREGIEAADNGDPATAAATCASALRLWRGPAYGDLAEYGELRSDANRLEELRLVTVERRLDSDLEMGRHHELTAELSALVNEHPFRERFRAQLMLALYRAGRQVDALEQYRQGSHKLRSELGIDPGPTLRRMQQDILNSEPHLAQPAPAAAATSPAAHVPTPAELPMDIPGFAGREGEVATLSRILTDGNVTGTAVAALSGMGGVGKSSLAIRVAHRVAAQFPDGQLYINLHGTTPDVPAIQPAEALARFLRSLGSDPGNIHDVDELAGRFRSVAAGRRILLVLDDAIDAAHVRPLLPSAAGCAVLITGRRVPASLANTVHIHQLGVLNFDEAHRLLTQQIGDARVTAEPDAAAEIIRLCGRLPLALCLAAGRLVRHRATALSDLVARLTHADRRLSELTSSDRAVRMSFDVSYARLDNDFGPPSSKLFRHLGSHPGPDFDVVAAAALLDTDTTHTEELLSCLVESQLLENHAPGRYRMHDLIRLYAQECAENEDTPAQRDDALRRLRHHYVATARSVMFQLAAQTPWRAEVAPTTLLVSGVKLNDAPQAIEWIDTELANLVSVAEQAADSDGDGPDCAVALCVALLRPLVSHGCWRDMYRIARVATDSATRTHDTYAQAMAMHDLGQMQRMLKLPEARHTLHTALGICETHQYRQRQPSILNELGNVYKSLGHFDAAIEYLRRCIDISRELGNGATELVGVSVLGFVRQKQGRMDAAVAEHRRAVIIAERIGNLVGQASVLSDLAYALLRSGDADAAMRCFANALELSHRVGIEDTATHADQLWGLGETLHTMGNLAEAREHWDRSAAILYRRRLITAEELRAISETDHPAMPQALEA